MLDKKSLKTQFITTFVLILILSLLATIATYYAGYIIFTKIEYKKMIPANYSEKSIPVIEKDIRKKGAVLLHESKKQLIDEAIPEKSNILYQVTDINGDKLYGTDHKKILNGQEDLYQKVNTTIHIDGKYARIIPVFESEGKIGGAVTLSYAITPHYPSTSDKVLFTILFGVIVFSPFIYIVFFTLFFSRMFAKNIGKPVNMLIDALRKVKEKDLDFDINYHADNELGKLCEAFDEMKNELKKSLISQWKLEQERQEMVQALAHDMKSPLSVIQGYAESLLEDGLGNSEHTNKYLRVIKENARQGSNLIKEMLYAAELESSVEGLQVTPVDIYQFLMKKKESYKMISRDKKIVFKVDVSCKNQSNQSEAMFPVDVIKLDRIFDNIMLNSIRYTPENGTIRINADLASDWIQFEICDTGKGFSNKDLAKLFTKFYKGDEARSRKNGHVGLGLYIAKKLVEMHGGSITAFNDNGRGACVTFVLPFIRRSNDREIQAKV